MKSVDGVETRNASETLPNIPQFMGVTVCGVDYNGL